MTPFKITAFRQHCIACVAQQVARRLEANEHYEHYPRRRLPHGFVQCNAAQLSTLDRHFVDSFRRSFRT
jgi:hypothetical protein